MTDATDTGAHRAQTDGDRITVLEAQERAALIERTTITNTLRFAALVITLSSAGVVGGAVAVYTKSITTEQRVAVLEGRVATLEASGQRKESDDRAQRDQTAEIRSDLRAMRVSLDDITRRMQRAEDERATVPRLPR